MQKYNCKNYVDSLFAFLARFSFARVHIRFFFLLILLLFGFVLPSHSTLRSTQLTNFSAKRWMRHKNTVLNEFLYAAFVSVPMTNGRRSRCHLAFASISSTSTDRSIERRAEKTNTWRQRKWMSCFDRIVDGILFFTPILHFYCLRFQWKTNFRRRSNSSEICPSTTRLAMSFFLLFIYFCFVATFASLSIFGFCIFHFRNKF